MRLVAKWTFMFFVILLICFSLTAQTKEKIGDLVVTANEMWKFVKTSPDFLSVDYQKASARITIYYFGNVTNEEAASKTVEVVQKDFVSPKAYEKAIQSECTVAKQPAVKKAFRQEEFNHSDNSILVTNYSLIFFGYKGNKYLIYTKEYFDKDLNNTSVQEFEKFISNHIIAD